MGGLFGGNDGPSEADLKKSAQGSWDYYESEVKGFDQDRAKAKAKMAVGGIKQGSAAHASRIGQIDDQYNRDMGELRSSQAYKDMAEYYRETSFNEYRASDLKAKQVAGQAIQDAGGPEYQHETMRSDQQRQQRVDYMATVDMSDKAVQNWYADRFESNKSNEGVKRFGGPDAETKLPGSKKDRGRRQFGSSERLSSETNPWL